MENCHLNEPEQTPNPLDEPFGECPGGCGAFYVDDCQCCKECLHFICECEEIYGTEAHSDRLEREARDRANAGDFQDSDPDNS